MGHDIVVGISDMSQQGHVMEDILHIYAGSVIWEESKEKSEKVEVESDWRILEKGRKYFAGVDYYLADQAKK